jgi:type II secretory pathway predicted ATPase ExeA
MEEHRSRVRAEDLGKAVIPCKEVPDGVGNPVITAVQPIGAGAQHAFRLSPDPTFFWRHGQYARAFDRLHAAVLADEGVAVLTGNAGTGKTTLVNALAQSLRNERVLVGRLICGDIEPGEMWSAVAHALRLEGLETRRAFTDGGRAAFCTVCAGKRAAVLLVDEAQTLGVDALVELDRLARALSPGDAPVLSMILAGRSELTAYLEKAQCAGLDERIGTWVEVGGLSQAEVASYIGHRLEIAGADPKLLPADVAARIAITSGGIPARINEMCHALVGTVDQMSELVTARTAVSRSSFKRSRWTAAEVGLVVAGLAVGMVVFGAALSRSVAPPPAAVLSPAEPIPQSLDANSPSAVDDLISNPADVRRSAGLAVPESAKAEVAPSGTRQASKAHVETVAPSTGAGRLPRATRRRSAITSAEKDIPAAAAPPVKRPHQNDEPDPSDVIDWLLKEGFDRR